MVMNRVFHYCAVWTVIEPDGTGTRVLTAGVVASTIDTLDADFYPAIIRAVLNSANAIDVTIMSLSLIQTKPAALDREDFNVRN